VDIESVRSGHSGLQVPPPAATVVLVYLLGGSSSAFGDSVRCSEFPAVVPVVPGPSSAKRDCMHGYKERELRWQQLLFVFV